MNILVADDDPQMQLAVKASLSRAGHEVMVTADGKAAFDRLQEETFDVVISDQRMPEMTGQELLAAMQENNIRIPFVMITAHGTINQAVEAMQLGASDFITKPFSADELVRVIERVAVIEVPAAPGQKSAARERSGRPIVTNDPIMIRVLEVCEAVAMSDATVLVRGESGTGKELVARLIHTASPRGKQPFVAVNCAALPENLLESELFGNEKGAFTGAQARKIGKFELAHGGTILLDEISEMELALQAKLLRVLQEREVDRVGGKGPISIDVRVVATTNRNLEDMVERGEFRADLYYRLNVIPVTLPSLRDRRGDIRLLVSHFMRQFLGDTAPVLPKEVLQTLEMHRWPGNVRELQNAVERAAILSRGQTPTENDFLLHPEDSATSVAPGGHRTFSDEAESTDADAGDDGLRIAAGETVHDMERKLIIETLRSTECNRTQAAKMLGISIRTLRNKLNEYKEQGLFEDGMME
jgi:two-component system response regulator FlrC